MRASTRRRARENARSSRRESGARPPRAPICRDRGREIRANEAIVPRERVVGTWIEARFREADLTPVNEFPIVEQAQRREHGVALRSRDRHVTRNGIGTAHFAQDRRHPPRVDHAIGIGGGHDSLRPPRCFEASHRELEGVPACRPDVRCVARKPRFDHVDPRIGHLSSRSARSVRRLVAAVVAIDDHVE